MIQVQFLLRTAVLGAWSRTMTQNFVKTFESFPGPWLFTKEVLLSLDGKLEEAWKRLRARKRADATNALRRMERRLELLPSWVEATPERREVIAEKRKL